MLGGRWTDLRFSTGGSAPSENYRKKVSCKGAGPQTDVCVAAEHPCLGPAAEIQPTVAAVSAESDLQTLDNMLA